MQTQHNQTNFTAHIRGAYGPGNLGDDVLLEVCINILRKYFPEQTTSVGLKNPKNPGYLRKYQCRFIHISTPIKTDFLFYGGGGQFFEFKNKKHHESTIQKLLEANRQGVTLTDIAKIFINRALKKNNISFQKSAAICLGLGPFENPSADSIRSKISPFLRSDYKTVRDNESFQIAAKYTHDLKIYTDPTFLTGHWLTSPIKTRPTDGSAVGVILRKWKLNDHGNTVILNTIAAARLLRKSGKMVSLISFYRDYDKDLIESVKEFDWIIWDPQKNSPSDFIEELSNTFDILVSTRAHGVLLPAQAGIPSVAVGIEPKLKNIHDFLPNGTLYCDGKDVSVIFNQALSCLERKRELVLKLNSDVRKQQILAESFLKDFDSWIKTAIEKLQ
ncbi:polysaccharide pyruvyl transferase family protein [Pseudomonas pseudonitroreducens]|uniref:polysaccharide pyruvyl transferase family protein n=1 Tax=Pseudomonas pseudonitroreducens TaxID=2892326 RepID=UPI001F2D6AAF|nr:polysaccharide pyruvyl transferase family protein [Pseudomonas pseudonitroreducens]